MPISLNLRVLKKDIIFISVALIVTIILRVILIIKAPTLYGQDAFNYVNSALNFASTGSISFGAGFPFIVFLGAFIKIFAPFFGNIVAARLFMLSFTCLLIVICYLIGKKISGSLLGFIAALVVTVQPFFLMYSIVPYNDVFAIAIGLSAFYFSLSSHKIIKFVVSPSLFYVAAFTRMDLYFAFILTLILSYFFIDRSVRKRIKIFYFFIAYMLPAFLINSFSKPYGRIGIAERIQIFLRPDLFQQVITHSFTLSSNQLIGTSAFILTAIGFVLLIFIFPLNTKVTFGRNFLPKINFKIKKQFFASEPFLLILCIITAFIGEALILTLAGFNYTWAFLVDDKSLSNVALLRQAIIILPDLHNRYLILPMILIGYLMAFPIYIILKRMWGLCKRKEQ